MLFQSSSIFGVLCMQFVVILISMDFSEKLKNSDMPFKGRKIPNENRHWQIDKYNEFFYFIVGM